MKTAIVLSDTHGNFKVIDKLLPLMKENDYVIHLGDCEPDILAYKREIKGEIFSVLGNCDGGDNEEVFEIEGVKILITHGNRYGVKNSIYKLFLRAKELGVTAVFYGHTHRSDIQEIDGITFVNPGTAGSWFDKSYCYAIFHNKKLTVKIVEIK